MPASGDIDGQRVIHDRSAKAARGGHLGERRNHVEVGDCGGCLAQRLDMRRHLGHDALQQVGFEVGQDLLCTQHPSLGFLQLCRDIASGVGQRLPDLVLGRQDRGRFAELQPLAPFRPRLARSC